MIGAARCSSSVEYADRAHHVGQRQDDDVGVGSGERDGDRSEAEQRPATLIRSRFAVMSFSVP